MVGQSCSMARANGLATESAAKGVLDWLMAMKGDVRMSMTS